MDDRAGRPAEPSKKRVRILVLICVLAGVTTWIAIYYLWPLYRLGCIDFAIGTLRTVVTAEKKLAREHPDHGYACALSDLGDDERLRALAKSGRRNGYVFELTCAPKDATGAILGFRMTALPLYSGMPAYCTDQSGVLRYDEGGSPDKCLQNGAPL